MDQSTFQERFRQAAGIARDFARTLVEEALPDTMVFRLRLNSSYDGNPLVGDERVYPEDSAPELAEALRECTEDQIVSTLWREGAVPEWINVAVIGETDDATLVEVLACGRFTAEEARLYHSWEGRPPFHVLGPAMPAGHVKGQRFSIHTRSECWSVREYRRLQRNAAKVWSLNVLGREIDGPALAALPDLPALEILEIHGPLVDRAALERIARYPRLRVLRLEHLDGHEIDLLGSPVFERLEVLTLEGLPSRSWGFSALETSVPMVRDLSLQASGDLILDGQWPPASRSISVTARRLLGAPSRRMSLEMFSLHVSDASAAAIEAIFAPFRALQSLSLQGTPLDEAVGQRLAHRFRLEYLNLCDTGLDSAAVRRIADAHPATRVTSRTKRS